MSHKIGRNDLCLCGSGKKYKKCCRTAEISSFTRAEITDFKWRQLRQLEGIVIGQHLIPYAMQELPNEIVTQAVADFFPEELPDEKDKEMLFENFFIPWFLFNWVPLYDFEVEGFDSNKTLSQNYIKAHENQLNSHKRVFIEEMNRSYYSFYCILEVEIEKTLVVKDILLGTTHTIKERRGTYQVKKGDIVFSRILTLGDQSIFVGMAPYIIPSEYHTNIIDFREFLISGNDGNSLSQLDTVLLDYFFEIIICVFNKPLPILMNTDNELIQFSKSYFKLMIEPEEALSYLLPLTFETDLSELLQDAEKDKFGKIKRSELPWMKKGNKKHKTWSNTILGQIIIEKGKLILETNSLERTRLGKELLKKHFGDKISFQKTLIETPDQKMKSLIKHPSTRDEESSKLLEIPEIQEQLKAMAKIHWENWFNEPIPALENKTPHEAAKTKKGQEKLEALLLEYERHDMEKSDNMFKADIDYLKKKLFSNRPLK